MARWKTLKSTEVARTGFFRMRIDECELPDGRIMPKYFVIEYPDWVNVIAVTSDKKIVMVEQYRHGTGEVYLEVPGGMTDGPKEDPLVGGQRELREETGFEANEWISCGYQNPNPAVQNNKLHTFLALDAKLVGKQELDPFEDLKVRVLPIREVYDMLERGELKHSLIAHSLFLAMRPLKERGLL